MYKLFFIKIEFEKDSDDIISIYNNDNIINNNDCIQLVNISFTSNNVHKEIKTYLEEKYKNIVDYFTFEYNYSYIENNYIYYIYANFYNKSKALKFKLTYL